MVRRRKSDLPKWRYEFDCRKCDNIREVHDPHKGRDGDYCIPCIERMDSRRPSPIHADEKERVLRCECFTPTVVGKKRTKARLLVLSERVTRREIIIRIKDGRAETVVAALDRLERIYGAAFYEIFKTITVDNGSEFADADGIERSARRKDAKRTTVYYCHAYSSCERGTNENINRMIRRQFPKGTDFDKVTAAEVKRVEMWLNDYPREILGFMSSAEAFKIAFDRAA